MNNEAIGKLQTDIEPLRQQIITHPVYAQIQTPEELRLFMQHHIFAVWDFMSLLKTLQNALTCTAVPWFPKGDAQVRYLINEIVAGEESDVDAHGNRKSHFELYLEAMQECGADTEPIMQFLAALQNGQSLEQAFETAQVPTHARDFVRYTFEVIQSGKAHVQAAVFTFGREDLIPSMFHHIIKDLCVNFEVNISIFQYYLERHIEVDGDHHSHLSLEMTQNLCGEKAEHWAQAQEAVEKSLQMRKHLWDGVGQTIAKQKTLV
ncbi:Protein of unknown function [Flexibacter flexilis DSM 6793]|uniref:DUF3050 domain-containing protein n=1 Tax=Flexibacter flexilis DSM 6793 TaxID=927664 RepID=A0A1I1M4M6_9BACT|nr:DUF3050 domain-containing protein [Flexibacter flexilis]SFC79702.1 Protein of unknown function [Flexibacter flexilis DSM 6793]